MATNALDSPRLQEMEELLQLAESTSKHVEELRAQLARRRDRQVSQFFASYLAMGISGLGIVYAGSLESTTSIVVTISSGVLILFTAFFLYNALTTGLRQRRDLTRELDVEIDILDRLISMTFDQFKRVTASVELSAVSTALFHIRIQRLTSR